MNAREFKAWFTGFTEGKETLTAEQFDRVRAEVAKMTAASIIQPLTVLHNTLPATAYVPCDPPIPNRSMG